MSRCGIVILAAGEARRMGRPKQLLELHGQTLLRRCIDTAMTTNCRPIFVVLGANAERLAPPIQSLPVSVIVNPNWQAGIGTSIRAGVAAAKDLCDEIVLLLCDQPLIRAEDIDQLVHQRAASGKLIAAARYSETLGTPAVFSAQVFDELLELGDNEGGKKIIQRRLADVEPLDLAAAAIDIDTEADFKSLLERPQDSIQ
jgi:molybdenum cofactor cytidylyltransferase